MANFTWDGDQAEANNWLPFGESVIATLKQLANGACVKQNYQPTGDVTITAQCNPDTLHITSGSPVHLLVRDKSNGYVYVPKKEIIDNDDTITITRVDEAKVSGKVGWSNCWVSKDLQKSATVQNVGSRRVYLKDGYYEDMYAITGACAFSSSTGALAVFDVYNNLTICTFDVATHTKSDAVVTIPYVSASNKGQTAIFSPDSRTNKFTAYVMYAQQRLDMFVCELIDGAYVVSQSTLFSTDAPAVSGTRDETATGAPDNYPPAWPYEDGRPISDDSGYVAYSHGTYNGVVLSSRLLAHTGKVLSVWKTSLSVSDTFDYESSHTASGAETSVGWNYTSLSAYDATRVRSYSGVVFNGASVTSSNFPVVPWSDTYSGAQSETSSVVVDLPGSTSSTGQASASGSGVEDAVTVIFGDQYLLYREFYLADKPLQTSTAGGSPPSYSTSFVRGYKVIIDDVAGPSTVWTSSDTGGTSYTIGVSSPPLTPHGAFEEPIVSNYPAPLSVTGNALGYRYIYSSNIYILRVNDWNTGKNKLLYFKFKDGRLSPTILKEELYNSGVELSYFWGDLKTIQLVA